MGRKLSKEEKEHEQRLQQELQAKLDMKYMKEAMKQARKAYALREVPIGCIIVYQDKIIGDRKSTRLNSSHRSLSRMPSSA